MKYDVVDIFHSIQGEGIDVGREVIFLRLAKCNLACVWCDTEFDTYTEMSLYEIVEKMVALAREHQVNHAVITGGEPLFRSHDDLAELIKSLKEVGFTITIETNGTILPFVSMDVDLFSVSPKLKSSGNSPIKPDVLRRWCTSENVQLKFVIADLEDMKEACTMIKFCADEIIDYEIPVIFQPEFSSNSYPNLMGWATECLGDLKLDMNVFFIPQVHKLVGVD